MDGLQDIHLVEQYNAHRRANSIGTSDRLGRHAVATYCFRRSTARRICDRHAERPVQRRRVQGEGAGRGVRGADNDGAICVWVYGLSEHIYSSLFKTKTESFDTLYYYTLL